MLLLNVALILAGQRLLASEKPSKVNQQIPPELAQFMSLDLEDRDASFVTGFDSTGNPVTDGHDSDDFDFSEDEFPDFSAFLAKPRPREQEEKPLNKEAILYRDDSDEASDWDDSSEYIPTREESFYTGVGAQGTTEEVTLNESTPELDSYLKTEQSEASGFDSSSL